MRSGEGVRALSHQSSCVWLMHAFGWSKYTYSLYRTRLYDSAAMHVGFFLPRCESIGLLTRLNGNVAGGGNVCLYEWAALCISRWERSDVLPAVVNPTAVLSMLCEACSVNDWVLVNTEETEPVCPLSLALPFWIQTSILEVLFFSNMFRWVAHLYKWRMHVWNPTDAEWAVAVSIWNAVFQKIPEFIGIPWFPWRKPLFRVCLNYTSEALL